MQQLINRGEYFKNIFANYGVFSDWYKTTPLSETTTDVPSLKTFTLISYEYNDSTSSMSVEGFKQHFAIDIYTYYKEFEATTKSIVDLLNVTDDEISVADSMITNVANIPENASSTDVLDVGFISNQQKTIQKKGILQIRKEQLSSKRTFTTKTFIGRFKHLFINVLSPSYNYVVGELNDEGEN